MKRVAKANSPVPKAVRRKASVAILLVKVGWNENRDGNINTKNTNIKTEIPRTIKAIITAFCHFSSAIVHIIYTG